MSDNSSSLLNHVFLISNAIYEVFYEGINKGIKLVLIIIVPWSPEKVEKNILRSTSGLVNNRIKELWNQGLLNVQSFSKLATCFETYFLKSPSLLSAAKVHEFNKHCVTEQSIISSFSNISCISANRDKRPCEGGALKTNSALADEKVAACKSGNVTIFLARLPARCRRPCIRIQSTARKPLGCAPIVHFCIRIARRAQFKRDSSSKNKNCFRC